MKDIIIRILAGMAGLGSIFVGYIFMAHFLGKSIYLLYNFAMLMLWLITVICIWLFLHWLAEENN